MNELNHFEQLESYIPIDLLSVEGFLFSNLVLLFFILVRYFGFVYLFYALFWKTQSIAKIFEPLHDKKIAKNQIKTELKFSLISSLIFGLAGYLMGALWQNGYTQIYLKFDEYPAWYYPVSFVALSLLHEVYFYFTHVWMHKPKIYKKVHAVHHISIKTTPWASFSFHPYEAIIQAAFLPIAVCILPIHPVVLITYLTFMTISAISNHLGVELIKSNIIKGLFISGTHHALHHKKFNCNYGLFYVFMDRLYATEHKGKY